MMGFYGLYVLTHNPNSNPNPDPFQKSEKNKKKMNDELCKKTIHKIVLSVCADLCCFELIFQNVQFWTQKNGFAQYF